jgi:hypothetical protein
MKNWKGFERKLLLLSLLYYASIHLDGLKNTMKNLSQESVNV